MPGEGAWKNKYCIGMPQIDLQHKQLLLTTEELLEAVRQEGNNGKKRYKETISYLKDYVIMHFGSEELFMQQMGYSQLERQKRLHTEFTQQLHEHELLLIRSDYDMELVRELASTLTRWWMFHIMQEDKQIGREAREKGLLPAEEAPWNC